MKRKRTLGLSPSDHVDKGRYLIKLARHHAEDVREALEKHDCHVASVVHAEARQYVGEAKAHVSSSKRRGAPLARQLRSAEREVERAGASLERACGRRRR